jgi:TorA maturation chaperone TorD
MMGGSREIGEILRAAATWRFIGLLLERPRGSWLAEIRSLSQEAGAPALAGLAESAGDASEGIYLRILGPGGTVSPREIAYRADDPGAVLASLSEFYQAFAFRPAAEDPPDHLAVEVGFLGYLHLKKAYAQLSGDPDGIAVTDRAITRLEREHLRNIAMPFAAKLAEARAPSYLVEAARFLHARIGDAPERSLQRRRHADDGALECGLGPADAPPVCGGCDLLDLTQEGGEAGRADD